jgi:hypothetical protein
MSALLTGFATRNAAALEGVYSSDADWVNAFWSFGSPDRGRASPPPG